MNVNIEYCNPFEKSKGSIWMKIEHCGRYLYALDVLKQAECYTVIDAACAIGYGTKILSSQIKKVYGIDRNIEYLREAKRYNNAVNIEYQQKDLDDHLVFDFITNTVDAVVCFETIEHVNNPMHLLSQIRSVLKKDGILLLSFPNIKYEKFDENGINKDPFHKSVFTIHEMRNMLIENGFHIELILGQGFPNLAYTLQHNIQKERNIPESSIDSLFNYDNESICLMSRLYGYPQSHLINYTYSYIIKACKL